jgi:hypothetical protein
MTLFAEWSEWTADPPAREDTRPRSLLFQITRNIQSISRERPSGYHNAAAGGPSFRETFDFIRREDRKYPPALTATFVRRH